MINTQRLYVREEVKFRIINMKERERVEWTYK